MKVYSVYQPFASLSAHGIKVFETRMWPAPKSIIGQTVGIAATKRMSPEAIAHAANEDFQFYYQRAGLPPVEELPCAMLIGTAMLHSTELITEEFLEDVSDEEKAYGWFEIGGYAWRLMHAKPLPHPIPIQGKQGIYDWHGLDAVR